MKPFYIDKDEAGLDEAGRGPLIGRVYASAVIIENDNIPITIDDSKKMTRTKREKAYKWIIDNAKDYSIGYAEPWEIDDINILEATCLAMKRCLVGLKKVPKIIIIDGCRWENKFSDFDCKVHSIVKGDSQYLSIASASILAKEEHDKYIREICKEMPELIDKYDLLNNMGYGTKKHLDGISKYGPSKYHRMTFKPIKKDI